MVKIPVDSVATVGYATYVAIKMGYREDEDFTRAYRRENSQDKPTKIFMTPQILGRFRSAMSVLTFSFSSLIALSSSALLNPLTESAAGRGLCLRSGVISE